MYVRMHVCMFDCVRLYASLNEWSFYFCIYISMFFKVGHAYIMINRPVFMVDAVCICIRMSPNENPLAAMVQINVFRFHPPPLYVVAVNSSSSSSSSSSATDKFSFTSRTIIIHIIKIDKAFAPETGSL